jgi:hypothetical protein
MVYTPTKDEVALAEDQRLAAIGAVLAGQRAELLEPCDAHEAHAGNNYYTLVVPGHSGGVIFSLASLVGSGDGNLRVCRLGDCSFVPGTTSH